MLVTARRLASFSGFETLSTNVALPIPAGKRKTDQSQKNHASAPARAVRFVWQRISLAYRNQTSAAPEDHGLGAERAPTEQGTEGALVVQSTLPNPQLDPPNHKCPAVVCHMDPTEILKVMNQFEKWACKSYMLGSPRADLLLTLIKFNVYRAMVSNIFTLGMTKDAMKEEAVSPFNSMGPGRLPTSIPPNLRPTRLQCTTPHHPWLDFFPTPVMRDNLLRAGDLFDEEQLCADVVGFCGTPTERTGLIVWGEPWNPYSWEVTDEFAKNWGWVIRGWVIQGCRDIFESTNYWRAQRGEKPLRFEVSLYPAQTAFKD